MSHIKTISLSGAAKLLKMSYANAYNLTKRGAIKIVSKKNGILVSWDDVVKIKIKPMKLRLMQLLKIAEQVVDQKTPDSGVWIGTGKASTVLGVSVYHVIRLADRGAIRSYLTDGGHLRICELDVINIKNYLRPH